MRDGDGIQVKRIGEDDEREEWANRHDPDVRLRRWMAVTAGVRRFSMGAQPALVISSRLPMASSVLSLGPSRCGRWSAAFG